MMNSQLPLESERHMLLGLELKALGVDVKHLEYYRWLVQHDLDPEFTRSDGRPLEQ